MSASQVLALTEPHLSIDLPPQSGATRTVRLNVSSEPGLAYQMGISASAAGLVLPDGRPLPCAWDSTLALTLAPGNPLLPIRVGTLAAAGSATTPLNVPAAPSLVGFTFQATAVSLDPLASSGVRTIIDPPLALTIQ